MNEAKTQQPPQPAKPSDKPPTQIPDPNKPKEKPEHEEGDESNEEVRHNK